jgi:hypothetical protein
MKQCDCCGGFLVNDGCPNCAATRPGESPRRWAKLAVCLALTAGGSMTLAACYGPPCSPSGGGPSCGPVDVVTDQGSATDAQSTDAPAAADVQGSDAPSAD